MVSQFKFLLDDDTSKADITKGIRSVSASLPNLQTVEETFGNDATKKTFVNFAEAESISVDMNMANNDQQVVKWIVETLKGVNQARNGQISYFQDWHNPAGVSEYDKRLGYHLNFERAYLEEVKLPDMGVDKSEVGTFSVKMKPEIIKLDLQNDKDAFVNNEFKALQRVAITNLDDSVPGDHVKSNRYYLWVDEFFDSGTPRATSIEPLSIRFKTETIKYGADDYPTVVPVGRPEFSDLSFSIPMAHGKDFMKRHASAMTRQNLDRKTTGLLAYGSDVRAPLFAVQLSGLTLTGTDFGQSNGQEQMDLKITMKVENMLLGGRKVAKDWVGPKIG